MKKIKRNLFLILIVALTLIVVPAFAQTEPVNQNPNIDYQLPYPGILADNPLYNLKTLRDKLVSFLISDPVKKAEFDLLQADKRLSVAIALFEKGKYELAESTISKGENYFEDAIKNIRISKMQGTVMNPSLLTNMELSRKKHKQILGDMVLKTSGALQKRFSKDLERMDKFINEVIEFKPK